MSPAFAKVPLFLSMVAVRARSENRENGGARTTDHSAMAGTLLKAYAQEKRAGEFGDAMGDATLLNLRSKPSGDVAGKG